MNVSMLLAETAAEHRDGTISIHRAWINRLSGKSMPVALVGILVIRIEPTAAEIGEHQATIRCEGSDGTVLTDSKVAMPIQNDQPRGLMVRVAVEFAKPGKYFFVLLIDGAEQARWWLSVEQTET